MLRSLAWRLESALKEDATWGIASVRCRLLWYLDVAADLAVVAGVLPVTEAVVADRRANLQHRRPESVLFPHYRAFARGGPYSAASTNVRAISRSTETSWLTPFSAIVTPNRRFMRAIVMG